MVVVERRCERGEERGDENGMEREWKGNGKGSEGRETSEYGRRKGGKTVRKKIWRKRGMKESEMEKRKRGNEERFEREDRP